MPGLWWPLGGVHLCGKVVRRHALDVSSATKHDEGLSVGDDVLLLEFTVDIAPHLPPNKR